MRTLLLRRLAPLFALLALVATACGSLSEPSAATVNGKHISADSIQNELEVVQGNKAYRDALQQAYGAQVAGAGEGTYDNTFVAQLLSLRVYYDLLDQDLARQGVKVTAADERQARATVEKQLGQLGKGLLQKFPDEYRRRLVHQEALVAKASEEAASGKIGKDYFAEHKDEFTKACVSHILVSSKTRSDADAHRLAEQLKAQLDAGADFAAVARANSEDTGSKDNGGDLDCGGKGRFVAPFDKAVFSLPVGKVSDPVKTEFGYHLILVRSREAASLGNAGADLPQKALNAYLLELTCGKSTDVTVAPNYGTWDKAACRDGSGLAKVTPPAKPASK